MVGGSLWSKWGAILDLGVGLLHFPNHQIHNMSAGRFDTRLTWSRSEMM